jgi:hypothetical protein
VVRRRPESCCNDCPANACDSAARFGIRAGRSYPIHSITSDRLVRLVSETGKELVGLCYFGDQESREHIETQLALKGVTPDSKTQPCDSSSQNETLEQLQEIMLQLDPCTFAIRSPRE